MVLVAVAAVAGGPFACGPDADDHEGWSEAAEMPLARGEVGAAVGTRVGDCPEPDCEVVAVVGGYSYPARTERRVDGYLPDQDLWVGLPDLPEARHHPAAAALEDGTFVVTGGAPSATDEEPTDDVWALAPDAVEWERLEPMPEKRWGHRLVEHDGRLYAIGGHGGTTTLVWERGEGWSTEPPIPQARDHLGAALVDGEIWVVAGRDDEFTARVDIYDPEAENWRNGPDLPEPTSAAAVGVVDGRLVVVSGEEADALTGGIVRQAWMRPVVDEQAEWKPMVRPPEEVHGAGDVVVGDGEDERLLVLGGASWHVEWSALQWTERVQVLDEPREAVP